MIFVDALGIAVSGGTDVPVPDRPVTAANYQANIASVLGVPDARAAAIAAEYPPSAYPSADLAFSTLVSDGNFACPALQLNRWTASRVPTYAYQFNDDHAPVNVAPPGALPPVATHGTELPYLFDQPNAPFPATLSAAQQALAASMRAAWANFAASGDPSSRALPWPSFSDGGAGAVARAAAATGRDGLRRRAPLCVLGRRMTHPPSPALHPDSIPSS